MRLTTPPSGSFFQLPSVITFASASRSASLSSDSSAICAGAPIAIWLVIVPEPPNELRNATSPCPSAVHFFWKTRNAPLFITSPRMLNP